MFGIGIGVVVDASDNDGVKGGDSIADADGGGLEALDAGGGAAQALRSASSAAMTSQYRIRTMHQFVTRSVSARQRSRPQGVHAG